MSDSVLTRDGPVAVPLDYVVPQGGELLPLTVRAVIDGSGAAVDFFATVQVIAPTGRVMGDYISEGITAGASADVTWFRGLGAGGAGGGQGINVQVFSTAGAHTWTKPFNAQLVRVYVLGSGGGGGGHGGVGATQTRFGGCAAGGGAGISRDFPGSDLPATVTVTLGAGGTAGIHTDGGDGNQSTFGQYVFAGGGAGGSVGGAGSGAQGGSGGGYAGTANRAASLGGRPLITGDGIGGAGPVGNPSTPTFGERGGGVGSPPIVTGNVATGGASVNGGAGGGSGGGATAGNVGFNGGAGGWTVGGTGGTAGTTGSPPTAGGNGTAVGQGGGGGGAYAGVAISTPGGTGGNGGPGGGGGGAGIGTGLSSGGAGGDGYCMVTTWSGA